MTQATRRTRSLAEDDPMIQLIGVNKWFGQFHVLRDIDLTVASGERIVICGPSGSGKSTLIRCINRLEEHQKGRIVVDGTELTNDLRNIDQVRREVRSEEHTSELQSLMRISYAVFCLKKKKYNKNKHHDPEPSPK